MNKFNFIIYIAISVFLVSCSEKVKEKSIINEKSLELQVLESYSEGLKELEAGYVLIAAKNVNLEDLRLGDNELNALAIKIVSRMVKLKSMEDWFDHVNRADIAGSVAYQDLELTEEEEALGEAAKLMTLMNLFQEEEQYEKCAIIKGRMVQVNKILRKGKK